MDHGQAQRTPPRDAKSVGNQQIGHFRPSQKLLMRRTDTTLDLSRRLQSLKWTQVSTRLQRLVRGMGGSWTYRRKGERRKKGKN